MTERIWITWENQRRNHSLSSELKAKLFQFDFKGNRIARYAKSIAYTLVTFAREKPKIIFVQNPSFVLAFLAVNYGRIKKIPVVVDAHNAGVYPFDGKYSLLTKIAKYLFRHAALTIVTNRALSDYVEHSGGAAIVLPDPLPVFKHHKSSIALSGKHNVLFICTFANDEPYMEIIEAGKKLDGDISIYITGRYKGDIEKFKENLPKNVFLTGFVPEEVFIDYLHSVDIILDLTTRENCLVCGAYEAVAAEQILIVSDTQILRQYFHKGTIHTENTSTEIAKNIEYALKNNLKLAHDVKDLKRQLSQEWLTQKELLESRLELLTQNEQHISN